jgi:hypothetical protein
MNTGYAEKIDDQATIRERTKLWYLPHFPVLNPNKPGKLRIVFDFVERFPPEQT